MPLLTLILVIVLVGVLLYCVNVFIPMEGRVKNILNIVVLVLWLLQAFGVFDSLRGVKVGQLAADWCGPALARA